MSDVQYNTPLLEELYDTPLFKINKDIIYRQIRSIFKHFVGPFFCVNAKQSIAS